MPMATRAGNRQFGHDWPSNTISPAVGAKNPEIMLKNVVLPAPLGPMMARSSPGRHLHRHVVDRDQVAELFGDAYANVGHASYCALLACSMPSSPRGKNSTTRTKISPTKDIQLTVIDEI